MADPTPEEHRLLDTAQREQQSITASEQATEQSRRDRDAAIVALINVHGWTAYRVAQALGITQTTVANIKARAPKEQP